MKILDLEGEEKKEGKYSRDSFAMLYFAYKPYRWFLSFVVVIGFLGRLLILSNSTVIGYWVDSLTKSSMQAHHPPAFLANYTSWDYVYLLSGLCLLGFAFSVLFRVAFSRLSAKAISNIYDEVTLRTSRYGMNFFDRNPTGKIVTRFSSDYGNVFRMFGGPLAEFFALVFDLILIVILLVFASPYYFILVALIAVLNFLVFKLNQMPLRQVRRDVSASRSPSISHFAETTQGSSIIRTYDKENNFIERFSLLDQSFLDRKLIATTRVLGFSLQMNALSALLLFITGLLSWYLATEGLVSVGSIGVAFGLMALSSGTVTMFFEWFSQLEEAMVGAERLNQFLRHPTEPGNPLPASTRFPTDHWIYQDAEAEALNSPKQDLLKKKSARLEVENLWLRYGDNLPWVLKGLSFSIAAGERIGVVGRTGSGKTSLIQAIFYLYPFSQGRVSIEGLSPQLSHDSTGDRLIDLNIFRRSISLISQEPTLFQGPLRDNLDPFHHAPDAELLRALQQVDLTHLQLDDWIEEKGKNLSLGEKQLICMARGLLQSSPIVIMDEATSSVDPQSEEIMVRATHEIFNDRTQIIIAHRLSTLEKCDRILWLENGEIKMFAPTKEVLSNFKPD